MTEFGKRNAHKVPFGTGASEIRACLEELTSQGYAGDIAVEYEFNPENNFPEVVKCIQFLRAFAGGGERRIHEVHEETRSGIK